jgi:hypothetical protein
MDERLEYQMVEMLDCPTVERRSVMMMVSPLGSPTAVLKDFQRYPVDIHHTINRIVVHWDTGYMWFDKESFPSHSYT